MDITTGGFYRNKESGRWFRIDRIECNYGFINIHLIGKHCQKIEIDTMEFIREFEELTTEDILQLTA